MNKEKVVQIATLVRDWAEKHVMYKRTKDFHRKSDLECMCAYASAILFEVFKQHNIKTIFAYSEHHCFLLHGNHVIDITATQFGFSDRVLIEKHKSLLIDHGSHWHEVHDKFHSLLDIYNACHCSNFNQGYPESQFFASKRELRLALTSATNYVGKHINNPLNKDRNENAIYCI